LRGALITPTVQHRAAVTERTKFAELVRAIWGYEGTPETRAILKLMCLLYPRPGELRLAHWQEFDLDRGIWAIPAKRTKMRREHRKPLSDLAIQILKEQQNFSGNRSLVFPSIRTASRPISENTMNAALRRLGYATTEMTSHGFRAAVSSLLNESGKWNPDAIEAELGHVGADQIRKAYHRALYWDERIRMADWWSSEISRMSS
jgi:integrase